MGKIIAYVLVILLILITISAAANAARSLDMSKFNAKNSIKISRQNQDSKSPQNTAPVAEANGPYEDYHVYGIQFDSSGSYDSDGTIVSYEWDFGDGFSIQNDPNPTHGYNPGQYIATLCVEDDDGDQDCDTAQVNIIEATCTDTDAQDLYTVGVTEGLYGKVGILMKTDYCAFGNVIEYFCQGVFMQSTSITCPVGEECQNGVCAPEEPEPEVEELVCTDSDGGVNLEEAGTTIGKYGVAPGNSTMVDYCISGQVNDGYLIEYFCSYGRVQFSKYECPVGLECNNGECGPPQIPDSDGDGVPDDQDICPGYDDNIDTDNDNTPDGCDICPEDEFDDIDADGFCSNEDNCPNDYNPGQEDFDQDGIGDVCEGQCVITQITNDNMDNLYPEIHGDYIVWQTGIIPTTTDDWQVYMYEISTGITTQITNQPNISHLQPKIHNDRIVWSKGNGSLTSTDIFMYDIASSTTTQITNYNSCDRQPDIYEDIIAYTHCNAGWYDEEIYLYDLNSGISTQVSNSNADHTGSPVIYEDNVVWHTSTLINNTYVYDLYLYTPQLGIVELTDSNDADRSPDIYEDSVVWSKEDVNNDDYILLHDISANTTTTLIDDNDVSGNLFYSTIYDNYLVFVAWSGLDPGLYIYNLDTDEFRQLTTDDHSYTPNLYENYIVWSLDDGNDREIYLMDLSTC